MVFCEDAFITLKSTVFTRVGGIWRQVDQAREVLTGMERDKSLYRRQKLVYGSPCDSGSLQ